MIRRFTIKLCVTISLGTPCAAAVDPMADIVDHDAYASCQDAISRTLLQDETGFTCKDHTVWRYTWRLEYRWPQEESR